MKRLIFVFSIPFLLLLSSCGVPVHLNPKPTEVIYNPTTNLKTEEEYKEKLSKEGISELSKELKKIEQLRNGVVRDELSPFSESENPF